MKGLTQRQQDVLDFIEDFLARENMAPTVHEVAAHFDVRPASAFAHLRALQRKGYIDRSSKARSLTLLRSRRQRQPGRMLTLPVLGKISAGLPLLADEQVDETIQIDPATLPYGTGGQRIFALRVSGDSMRDAGILDGDVVVAKEQATANPGDVVIALVEGESTIKYFHAREGRIELRPANPAYQSRFHPPEDVRIQGVMTGLIRTM